MITLSVEKAGKPIESNDQSISEIIWQTSCCANYVLRQDRKEIFSWNQARCHDNEFLHARKNATPETIYRPLGSAS